MSLLRHSILLTNEELNQLVQLSCSPSARIARRAQTILELAQGLKVNETARKIKINRRTVTNIRDKFLCHRIKGITADAPRIGPRCKRPSVEEIENVILNRTPPNKMERWPYRQLAAELKVPLPTLYRKININKIPRSRHDLEMMMYQRKNRRISDIQGLFISPCLMAMAFKLENSIADDDPIHLKILSQKAIENFQQKNNELIDLMRNNYPDTYITTRSKGNLRDFLMFLLNINKQIPQDREIVLVMNSMIVDSNDKITRWLEKERRFHIIIWTSKEQWLDFIFKYISSGDEECKRIIYYRLESILADYELYSMNFHDNSIPFSCIFPD